MNSTSKFFIFFFIVILGLACSKKKKVVILDPNATFNETELSQRVDEIREIARSIPLNPLSISDEQLQYLEDLGSAKIIGLGEATHGTREFYQTKLRILQYLVKKHQLRILAAEFDYGESLIVDEYITGGVGDLEQIMKDTMSFWWWQTEGTRELLEWMHHYNLGKAKPDQIRFVGLDCQLFKHNLRQLQQRTASFDESLAAHIDTVWTWWDFTAEQYRFFSETLKKRIAQRLEEIQKDILQRESDIVIDENRTDYETIKQLVKVLLQVSDFNNSPGVAFVPANKRDEYLAENALWLSDLYGTSAPIAIWGHNVHISKSKVGAGLTVMGEHLKEEIKDDYQNVGFSLSTGSITAVDNITGELKSNILNVAPPLASINYIFFELGQPAFFLDLKEFRATVPSGHWLNKEKDFISIGIFYFSETNGSFANLKLNEAFDYLFHFDQTNHSILLQ